MEYRKFSKIPSLRNLLKDPAIANRPVGKRVIQFHGTLKLHGTHGAIRISNEGEVDAFSRNRHLTIDKDNHGFAAWVSRYKQYFADNWQDKYCDVWLYGEWVGSSIQKGHNLALSKLPSKQFVLFGMYFDFFSNPEESYFANAISFPENWSAHGLGMWSINDCGIGWKLHVDLDDPNLAVESINEWVAEVEANCPWGNMFDIEGTGEGIVFTNLDDPQNPIQFKAKGEKHQATNERKVKEAIDPIQKSKVSSFVNAVVTESRLEQGVQYLKEMNLPVTSENTGIFIKWVIQDILTEEKYLFEELELDWNQVKKSISKRIVSWYKSK